MRFIVVLALACSNTPATPDASVADASSDAAEPDEGSSEDLTVWPNSQSCAISDGWIASNHDTIREMHPRVLALNFVNGRTNADMEKLFGEIFSGMNEGSRYHAYSDPKAPQFLFYAIAKSVDLTDHPPPSGWTLHNSTLYPRKPPTAPGNWGFDYAALYTQKFADLYRIADPENPSHNLTLCELLERCVVHEVWIYGDADVPDVSAAEVLERKQRYDASGQKLAGKFDRCAGNGCFDDADLPTCGVSVRIGWVNNTRGPGCYLHSMGHGFEGTANNGSIPALRSAFTHFGNFDLDTRFPGTPFNSFYACGGATGDCITFSGTNALSWDTGSQTGTMNPYSQGCGNVHFPPNARNHYDYDNPSPVLSTCEHFGMKDADGGDTQEPFTSAKVTAYETKWPDCGGGWQVYWRQSFPGYKNLANARSWWPYMFY